MADEKYRLTLEGSEIDEALLRLANYEDEGIVLGSRKGVMLGPGSEYYHKNARYYAELAQSAVPGDTTSAVRWDIDQSALTDADREMARKNIRAGGSNRNLLDNPWFTVRQRGDGPFGMGYGVDRWTAVGGAPTITPRNPYGVTVSWSTAIALDQYLSVNAQWLAGKTVTLSVMVDGTVYSASGVFNTTGSYIINISVGNALFRFGYFTSKQCPFVRVGNSASGVETTINIDAIKLELGSVSTLANDAPPDYWQELDKCLYYFERITNNGSSPLTIGAGFADGVNNLYAPVRMHRKRAGIATVSYSGTIYAGQRSSNIVVSSMTQYNSSPDGIITLLAVTPSSFTNNEYYRLALGAGAHIDFSAEP